MPHRSAPTRTLADRPNLDQLRRQARELLDGFRRGDVPSTQEVRAHYRQAAPSTFALHDAQLVVARAYGFDSWPKLKAFVDGVTVRRLLDAVRNGDLDLVRSMVSARPELVHLDAGEDDEHRALHHAVLQRRPEIVRFLMQHGADARKGIWPHRSATTAFTFAVERGYDEIVAIIEEEERRRSSGSDPVLRQAAERPGLVESIDDSGGGSGPARAAIAAGDAAWLRARHAGGRLGNGDGLLSSAVEAARPEMLSLLLDLGLDPDESGRLEGVEEMVPTWGGPLRSCARSGNVMMAEILLAHGANPNTNVYAASSAMYEAYKRQDEPMKALLERHGGRLTATAIGELGLVEHASELLAEYAEGHTPDGIVSPGSSVAQDLLWGAMGCPSPAIAGLALAAIDWTPDDSRWHGILENGLYLGPDSDRPRHLETFRLVLDRCDPDVRSGRGTTLLHEVAASRGGLTAADRIAYTTLLLDRGARMHVRDHLLQSTPLGWACRWGRIEMVSRLLARGADPMEAGAESWATPAAWARRTGNTAIGRLLEESWRSESAAHHDDRTRDA